jgi:hypothetical protein
MRAAGLGDVAERGRLGLDCLGEAGQARQQNLGHGQRRGDMDRGRKHVVGALPHIDMIVRMHLLPSAMAGEVCDHLVGIHVRRGARAGLEDVDRELRIVQALGDLHRCAADRVGDRRLQQPEALIDIGRRGLDQAQRADHAAWQPQARNGEVVDGALSLRAP